MARPQKSKLIHMPNLERSLEALLNAKSDFVSPKEASKQVLPIIRKLHARGLTDKDIINALKPIEGQPDEIGMAGLKLLLMQLRAEEQSEVAVTSRTKALHKPLIANTVAEFVETKRDEADVAAMPAGVSSTAPATVALASGAGNETVFQSSGDAAATRPAEVGSTISSSVPAAKPLIENYPRHVPVQIGGTSIGDPKNLPSGTIKTHSTVASSQPTGTNSQQTTASATLQNERRLSGPLKAIDDLPNGVLDTILKTKQFPPG
ncbi:MAG: hypothetical protein K2X57_28795 [Xanthobacteraceae bacterium]|nr:hypothetical protein [Xanthobacteraceae bacterium]